MSQSRKLYKKQFLMRENEYSYWSGITAFTVEEYSELPDETLARYGFLQMIMMEERELFASREVDESEIAKPIQINEALEKNKTSQFKSFLQSRKWADFLSGGFFLSLAEISLKFIGALLVDLHVGVTDRAAKNPLWYIPAIATVVVNAFVAQSLLFLGNVILHARAALDGVITVAQSILSGSPKKLWSGIRGLARGLYSMAMDGIYAVTVGPVPALAVGMQNKGQDLFNAIGKSWKSDKDDKEISVISDTKVKSATSSASTTGMLRRVSASQPGVQPVHAIPPALGDIDQCKVVVVQPVRPVSVQAPSAQSDLTSRDSLKVRNSP